jgi:hypothetical protein
MPLPDALRERLRPAGTLVVGFVLIALNVVTLALMGNYFPFLMFLGCAFFFAGGFGVVIGSPKDPYGNPPFWTKAGAFGAAAFGVLVALLIHATLLSE